MKQLIFTLLICLGLCGPASAQQEAGAMLRSRADQVVALLRGQGDPAMMFTPAFLAQVPPAQLRAVSQQVVSQYGAVRGLERIDAASPQSGVMNVGLERAVLHIQIVVEPR